MNYTETFSDFSSKLGPTDIALYAGVGIIIWVLFKDRVSPVQKFIKDWISQFYSTDSDNILDNITDVVSGKTTKSETQTSQNLFFDLVVSWKQTRDLAEKSGCQKAVEVADQMFPYLSPMVCIDQAKTKKEKVNEE